jgi:TolA-binding protein
MGFWLRSRGKGSSGLPFLTLVALCGFGLGLAGCADFTDESLQRDVSQLRRDVNALMIAANRGRGDSEALNQIERRSREQAAGSAQQTAALTSRLDNMNADLTKISARLDSLSQKVEALTRQTPPPRVGAPQKTPSPPPSIALPPSLPAPAPGPGVVGSPPDATRGSAAPPPAPSTGGETAQETYQAAYLDFSKGRYPMAISAFRDFVRRFPDSPLADSAQYNIGESYFSLARASAAAGQADKAKQEMEQSVQEFRRVLVNYPRGSKVPTALYKEALALTELKQTSLAEARLQYLLDHFPQSEEAPLAKERLAAPKQ